MTKEKWMDFCKAVTPHMNAICTAMAEAGIAEKANANIAVNAGGYASMFVKCDGIFYDCTSVRKEGAYQITRDIGPAGASRNYIGEIPRIQEGGENNARTQAAKPGAEEDHQGRKTEAEAMAVVSGV